MQPISSLKIFNLLIFLILLIPGTAEAYDKKLLINQAIETNLHLHPQWIALNHYYSVNGDAFQSEIDDPSFFLSKNGPQSPIDELKASLYALLDQPQDTSSHFFCRYPARLQFFIKQLELDNENFNKIHCLELNTWLKEHISQTATLIYPSSYLNNPSSVFGHTFLRFNRDNYEKSLSFAVDFAAIVNPDEGLFSYIYKGISGGFKGIYSIKPYYVKSWEYSDVENRKVWEYELNLNETQVYLMLLHLWELRGKFIDYYFTDENCSYQILALINVAQPQLDFRTQFSTSTIPADTVRYLINNDMVTQIEYTPPLELRYSQDIELLSKPHQQLIQSFNSHPDIAFETHRKTLEANPELINITTNYLYTQIQHGKLNRKKGFEVITKLNYLRMNNSRTYHEVDTWQNTDEGIDNAHKSHRFSLGIIQTSDITSTSLAYRPAYHDFTDPVDSFNPGSEINLMDTTLSADKNGLHIDKISFLSLSSLRPGNHFSDPLSWRFQLHRKRFYFDPDGELVNQANLFVGKAFQLYEFNVFALGQVGISYNSIQHSDFSFNTGFNIGSLLQANGYTLLLNYQNGQLNSTEAFRQQSLEISNSIKLSNRFSWYLSFMLTNTQTYKQHLARSTLNYYF